MNIAQIAAQLEQTGYIVLDQPLPAKLSAQLWVRCHDDDPNHAEPGRFHAARIGRGSSKQQIGAIRGDVISWLDDTDSADHAFLAWMEKLRVGLNAALYLGLFDYECHYAIYAAGTGYAKHSDVLNGKKNRILSTVFYLNENWQSGDKGQLALFNPAGDTVIATVNPTFGTMIIFLSEYFPHEVLLSHHTRRSIAGWFRVSGS